MRSIANKLTALYFKITGADNISFHWRKEICTKIEKLLSQGISEDEIAEAIKKNPSNFISIIEEERRKDNLLSPNTFYYHPFLQIVPPPPTIQINKDGTFTESYSNEEFYLRIKEYFTIKNAIDYFFSKFTELPKRPKRDLGAMKFVYERHMIPTIEYYGSGDMNPVDLLLFTIDAARAYTYDLDIKLTNGILGLGDYVDDGLAIYQERINNCKLNDLTHVQ